MSGQFGFRKPDSQYHQDWAVWYGKGGPKGDCATEVERSTGGYTVKEYQYVAGLIGDIPEGKPYLVSHIFVPEKDLEAARVVFDSIATAVEIVAKIGTVRISEQGPDNEEYAEALPEPDSDYQQQGELV